MLALMWLWCVREREKERESVCVSARRASSWCRGRGGSVLSGRSSSRSDAGDAGDGFPTAVI